MAQVVTAIVAKWKVNRDVNPAAVEFDDTTNVSMFVGDGANSADNSAIFAKYILEKAPNDLQMQTTLLKAARDGLLQVVNLQKFPITQPSVPPAEPAPVAAQPVQVP
jgi:hypothetical protein